MSDVTLNNINNSNVEKAQEIKFIEISPDCDIEEAQDNFIVNVDMPGLNQNDIRVELDRDMLTVEGKSLVSGLEPRIYKRQFRVMRGLDASKVQADYKFGILTLKLAKTSTQQPKQISIQCE